MAFFRKGLKKVHKTLKQNEQEIKKWEKKTERPPMPKKSRIKEYFVALIGLILLLLAIWGVIAGGLYFKNRSDSQIKAAEDEKLAHYRELIAPVVLFDTGEFVHPEEANNLSLLIPAYFRAQEKYGYTTESVTNSDAGARFTLNEEQVKDSAEELFGRSVICQSFTLDGVLFEYTENEHCFRTPITFFVGMYAPEIINKEETGDGVLLTVQCVELPEYRSSVGNVGKTVQILLKGAYGSETVESVTVIPDP